MVAARSASPAADARVASELGSLFLLPTQIGDRRWRLEAYVRIVPALHRLELPLDWIRARVKAGCAAAICPQPLRDQLAAMLVDALDIASGDALAAIVEALWTPSRAGASLRALGAALMRDDFEWARRIAADHELEAVLRSGCIGGRFVGVLRAPGSEEQFEPSFPLLAAMVGAIDASRIGDAERLAGKLGRAALPELARLALRFGGVTAALARLRAIRETSVRSRALLALVTDAIALSCFAGAHALAAKIETRLARDHARLLLARAHAERGEIAEAMTEINAATDPRVDADRRILVNEIGTVLVRRHEEWIHVRGAIVRGARPVPGWPHPRDRLEVVFAVTLTRLGRRLGDEIVLRDVARALRGVGGERAHRLAFLSLAERAGIQLDDAFVDLRCAGRGLDAYAADRVAMRAARLAGELPSAMTRGLVGNEPLDIDARSLERAMFDEGVALSAAAPQRRRVLIGAARHCLRDLAECSPDVADTRLRTLVHLGGALAEDAIAAALHAPASHASGRALDALADLAPREAGSILLSRYIELRDARVDVDHALRRIELAGGLARGFAAAFVRARKGPGARWLLGFIDAWRERSGALPSIAALDAISQERELPRDPLAFLGAITQARDAIAGDHHVALAERLAHDRAALEHLLLAEPPRIDEKMLPWTVKWWSSLLSRSRKISLAPAIVARFARILGCRADVLLAGDLFQLGARRVEELVVGRDKLRIQLLDKRVDLLTYLRFADVPARSCYRSDSWFYGSTEGWTIVAWKDPLTFCFRIERDGRPCGFLLGGFAEVAGAPAVVLNSLHVRPRRLAVRERILRAVERMLCEPLGIAHIGIANVHGGYGPLPANYRTKTVEVTRRRALHVGGEPVTSTFDDISRAVNERVVVGDLYWRT